MLSFVIAALLASSIQDQLEGAEIGDATQFVAFRTGGKYHAEHKNKAGRTVAKGTWKIDGGRISVKVANCTGPACPTFGKAWSAEVEVPAERAMTLKSEPATAPLKTGSYYCRSQGCEKRIGVEVVSHRPRVDVMRGVVDFLIDGNRARDVTVVWRGKERPAASARSSVSYCTRDEARAKQGAELVAADLSTLGWFDKVTPQKGEADCLYDVRVVVGDEVRVPVGGSAGR